MKAVFLDRDGTIIKETAKGICNISEIKFYRNVPLALRMLQDNGYKLIIITNQSLIARGLIPEKQLHCIHRHIKQVLRKKGVRIAGIYYCPHHPTKGVIKRYSKVCDCRKPQPGLLDKAIRNFNIEPHQSFFIGDSLKDMQAAKKVRIKFILVLTGYGKKTLKEINKNLSVPITTNLLKASRWIISHKR